MRRELGLRSIPLEEIVGTAVAGPAQRGSDFTPMRAFRTQNWEGRWQRINRAVDRLTILPPIDVIRAFDRYWIEDGHNRVAAALANGQVEIDATVTELRPPNAPSGAPVATSLAPMLETSQELRSAGEGRFSAQAAGLLVSSAAESEHDHADQDAGSELTIAAERAAERDSAADDAAGDAPAADDAAADAARRDGRAGRA